MNQLNNELECYTVKDVQHLLKISQAQAYNLFNSYVEGEKFPSFKIGGSLRITKKEFNKWLEAKTRNVR